MVTLPYGTRADLDEMEAEADARRVSPWERNVELQGGVIQRYRDWAVTTIGVESLVSGYWIGNDCLGWNTVPTDPTSWEWHMFEKAGDAHGSYLDLLKALDHARRLWPTPDSWRTKVAG